MPTLDHIRSYMTEAPHTVDHEELLSNALRTMTDLGIHHLPVVKDGHLVGMLSHKDIVLSEALLGDAYGTVAVSLVMSAPPFTCGPEAHLDAVAREMLEQKCGSAIVVERDSPTHVVGIFTVTDALRVLSTLPDGDAGE